MTFIALCGDRAPHFTTIAHFVSTLGDDIARVVAAVVALSDAQGLVGREMFAIDGVKLPSNAAKRRSGLRADFAQQAEKYEALMQQLVARHRTSDAEPPEPPAPLPSTKEQRRLERLAREVVQLRGWLAAHPTDRRGPRGGLRQSNRTDNESARMGTGKGVLQGYTGAAAVDARHQIILEAQAHGTGSEQEVLVPVVDALIADAEMRQRDQRFATQAHHRAKPGPLHTKSGSAERALPLYRPSDITYDPVARTCVCPAGKSL